MSVYLDDGDVRLYAGDCVEVMRELDAESVDAVVTDPPYGWRFMGKAWDGADIQRQLSNYAGSPDVGRTADRSRGAREAGTYDESMTGNRAFQAWCETWAREALRVLKPGGHLLSFCGPRTYHRLACAIEDAGFEIRDSLHWLYGSGFPKSLDVSKAIDREAGAEREVIRLDRRKFTASPKDLRGRATQAAQGYRPNGDEYPTTANVGADGYLLNPITAPATPKAAAWQGWGTALKPAHEPIVLARKPLAACTVARQVLATGTGALNVDGCRVVGPTATIETWGQDANLCASCAADAVANAKPRTLATRASTAGSPAALTTSARAETPPAATSRADIGCSNGRSPEAPATVPYDVTSSSTAASGKTRMDPSPTATSSTTSTATSSTTGSRICSSCGAESTGDFTTGSPMFTPMGQPQPITSANTLGGRWPSNALLTHDAACEEGGACAPGCPVGELDAQARGGAPATILPVCGDAFTTGASTSGGASRAAERSTPSLLTDGPGSRPTDPFPTGTRSTTGTGIRSTTTLTTSNSSPPGSTTTSTSASERTMSSEPMASSGGAASGAPSTGPLASSSDELLAPIRATASPASASTSASGRPPTPNGYASTSGESESVGPSRFFPTFRYEAKADGTERDGATHPTVKPLALMRWLCRLVTPPGGTILDPFAGSGTTLLAARNEGFRAIGIEREPEYLAMSAHRLRQLSLFASAGA